MKRRSFIKNFTGLGLVGLTTGFYTFSIEPYWVEYVKLPMPIRNLPDNLVGKKIVQISDIHIGDEFDWNYIISSFKQVKKMKPDYVVYTGDFVSYRTSKQIDQLNRVFEYVAKGELGTFGILGNHDYGHRYKESFVAVQVTTALENAGVKVLRNSQAKASGLNIIGIDDFWGTNFYPDKVMNKICHDEANLVLCHNPDVADLPVWNGYKGWILSGHTHGGQCKPPFLPPPVLPVQNREYVAGKYDLNDGRYMYINRALGCSYPVRFNVRPEITVFTLEKEEIETKEA
ncbi:metallophosphoesterase [Chondrinema litorale]|uniref:metallophosphoesterase n=1 Tax=Chondrinema litorale TaxID=2994555 RepID=UPI0025435A52|nr:metallophosphoesterase [Chondrinema litorale]UZR96077.1 metallophosphoesterase [Chondrinema litorale]